QRYPMLVSDGAGGAIITWEDERSGLGRGIYAQRVNAAGSTLWMTNGVAISTIANRQYNPALVSDSSGGAIIIWEDYRNDSIYNLYAQRVNSNGSTLWIPNGVAICTTPYDAYIPTLVSDGSSGAIITWEDERADPSGEDTIGNFYAQRVNSSGSTLWFLNGVSVCTIANDYAYYYSPILVSDGSGGAIISWLDERDGVDYDVYSQRLNSEGSSLWTLNGVAICTSSNQSFGGIVSDDSTGVIIT